MKAEPRTSEARGSIRTALITLALTAVVGAVMWLLIRTPGLRVWPGYWGFGALAVVVTVVILHGFHEAHRIRRVVAKARRSRPRLSDQEFGSRFYDPTLAPVASRLRCLLAEHLGCDLAGLIPTDDFEQWLALSAGPDSAADTFFEEVAIEFRLTRWPDGLGSFDALVRFVAEQAPASRPPGSPGLPC